ncbi:MAG: copper resistance protein CopC [Alphaproteobacteria bacterium TMED89]|nr:hypothetical protein [Rhodospirillaceae bacterium]RPH19386.1 MAG: copper resistance protein CopC [Alphaproteobacteria bacterium TMED89]
MKSFITALALLLIATTSALAHSKMSGSTPSSGDTAEAGLEVLDLTFDRKVRLTRVDMHQAPEGMTLESVMKTMMEGQDHDIEGQAAVELTSDLPKSFVDEVSLGFSPLEAGVYMVHWIAVALDGHTMEGDIHFAVSE